MKMESNERAFLLIIYGIYDEFLYGILQSLIKCWWCKNYPLFIEVLRRVWWITALVFHSEFFGGLLAERLMLKLTQPEKIPLFMRPIIPKNMYGLCHVPNDVCYLINFYLNIPWETS